MNLRMTYSALDYLYPDSSVKEIGGSDTEGKFDKTVVRPALLNGAETATTTREGQYLKLTHYSDNKSRASVQENYRKTTQVVRPCDEDERGAHSEKNARCGHTREKKTREAKTGQNGGIRSSAIRATPANGTSQGRRRQHNKQGRMEE